MNPHRQTERFYEVVWPHRAMLLRMALVLSGRQADAEDLAQETMLKAYRSIDRFRDGSDAKAWLMTILRNTRIDRLRQLHRQQATIALDDPDNALEARTEPEMEERWKRPEDILEAFSDRQVIDALADLPEEIRWTLLLVDVQQLQMSDAAGMLDVPVGTIKSRLHRGRAMLRSSLAHLEGQGVPGSEVAEDSAAAAGARTSEVRK